MATDAKKVARIKDVQNLLDAFAPTHLTPELAGDVLGYWFDCGDDWWHQINVRVVEEMAGQGTFPKVIQRIGESPPQYVNWDEEDQ